MAGRSTVAGKNTAPGRNRAGGWVAGMACGAILINGVRLGVRLHRLNGGDRSGFRTALVRRGRAAAATAATAAERARAVDAREAAAARRARYQDEISAGVDLLLEPRRDTCPWCGSAALRLRAETTDLVQGKPGRFHYEQCRDCGHVFQNPMLSLAGLAFYYRDFCEGAPLTTEGMFGAPDSRYRARVELLPPDAKAKAWLDVGAGNGYFCLVAGGLLPGVTFDACEMGEGISVAARRGWVRQVHMDLFPDIVDQISGRYDVISMFRYLERALDPRLELDAAAKALAPGGHLVIEVPHAQTPSSSFFRGFWIGLFAPQHLHLIPPENLLQALRELGLRPVTLRFTAARPPADAVAAVYLLAQRLQPDPTRPWVPYKATWARRLRRLAALAVTAPLYPPALAVDVAMLPILRTGQRGTAYQVVARKD